MNQPKMQAMRQQKQMSTAAPFTIDQVIAQNGILASALTQAFGDAGKYIIDLKAQVAAGNPVTQDQLNTLGASLTAMTAATQAFDVTNTEPVAPIAPLPPVTQ